MVVNLTLKVFVRRIQKDLSSSRNFPGVSRFVSVLLT